MNWLRLCTIPLLAMSLLAQEAPRRPRARVQPGPAAQPAVVAQPGAIFREGRFWVEEVKGSVPAASNVRVMSLQGGIEVRGEVQNEITYRVRKRVAAGSEAAAREILAEHPLRVVRRGRTIALQIEGEGPVLADYFVAVPKNTGFVTAQTGAGGIAVTEIDGSIRVESAGGAIQADGIGGSAELETGGGPILMGRIGGRVRAETAGGIIKLASGGADVFVVTQGGGIDIGSAVRSVRAETGGGEVRVARAGGDVMAQSAGGNIVVGEAVRVTAATAGGSISVERARSIVRAETASGSISLARCAGPIRAETATGSITAYITAAREAWGESLLETNIGDIDVVIPRDLALSIRAAIEMARPGHTIVTDLPLNVNTETGAGRGEVSAEGAINGGGPQLRLRTVSGSIKIRSQK